VHFRKFFVGFCAFLEVPHGILCIYGRPWWDFVHIWKFLMGFSALLEVPRGIFCIFGSSSCDFVQFLSSSWDCMLYHEEIPKMHKIP
jgi:hypothetical protein